MNRALFKEMRREVVRLIERLNKETFIAYGVVVKYQCERGFQKYT